MRNLINNIIREVHINFVYIALTFVSHANSLVDSHIDRRIRDNRWIRKDKYWLESG